MKQQKLQGSAKRFLAMMTAFAMTLALVLEAMPTSAKAASTQGVREVDNFTDLYYALGLSGNCEIKLTKNIEERWSDKLTKKYVFEVHGEKILNLNGHDIIMHDEYRSVGVGDSREDDGGGIRPNGGRGVVRRDEPGRPFRPGVETVERGDDGSRALDAIRDRVGERLAETGDYNPNVGGSRAFAKALEPDAKAFCEHAKKYELLLVPSNDFGMTGYFRMAYCVKRDMIGKSMPAFKALWDDYHK